MSSILDLFNKKTPVSLPSTTDIPSFPWEAPVSPSPPVIETILASQAQVPVSKPVNEPLVLPIALPSASITPQPPLDFLSSHDWSSEPIPWTTQQRKAISAIVEGRSCMIIGPAGTGKTAVAARGIELKLNILQDQSDSLEQNLTAWIGAFTRQASFNLANKVSPKLRNLGVSTIHSLLQFAPCKVIESKPDPETGQLKQIVKTIFRPQRNHISPLDPSLKFLVVDEVSMLGLDLLARLFLAFGQTERQIVFLGDVAQLSPVMGQSAMFYQLQQLTEVIYLSDIHRQAQSSAGLRLAHSIREGNIAEVSDAVLKPLTSDPSSDLKHFVWKVSPPKESAAHQFANYVTLRIREQTFDPYRGDLLLCPFNKHVGTVALNRLVASHYDEIRTKQAAGNPNLFPTYEVKASFFKHYLKVGDLVRLDSKLYVIQAINENLSFTGDIAAPSMQLDREGHYSEGAHESNVEQSFEDIMSAYAENEKNPAAKLRSASHSLKLLPINLFNTYCRFTDGPDVGQIDFTRLFNLPKSATDSLVKLSAVSDFNNQTAEHDLLGYAITVHKSQGSQGENVIFCLHSSHNISNNRELVYTALTRFQRTMTIVSCPSMLTKACLSTQFPGITWQEKLDGYILKLQVNQGATMQQLYDALCAEFRGENGVLDEDNEDSEDSEARPDAQQQMLQNVLNSFS